MKMVNFNINNTVRITIIVIMTLFGFSYGQGGTSKELFHCRQMCYQKFVQDWHHCMDFEDCKNCWNSCDQTLGPFTLNVQSASRQGSLVLTDIAWDQAVTNSSKQCLVTWEVSGGGLMGNLLTDSSTVELSLWPDTVYHVQVTCKNKETGGMRRSFKLIVDTRKLSGSVSTLQPIAMDTSNIKTIPGIYSTEPLASDSDDRMKILKDSSKDFISNEPIHNINNNNNIRPSITSQSINSQINNDEEIQRIPIDRTPSVLRSKLASSSSIDYTTDILSRSILFAMMGSLVLFLGIVIIYSVTRGRRDAASSAAIDKQGLINSEILSGSRTLHV